MLIFLVIAAVELSAGLHSLRLSPCPHLSRRRRSPHGSGNIGATNVSRKSPVLGVLTLLLDALKGTLRVIIRWRRSFIYLAQFDSMRIWLARMVVVRSGAVAALAALFAILGHMFPVWLQVSAGARASLLPSAHSS